MACYRCSRELIEGNISKEHIILESLGGKLTSKDLLCVECNSFFGTGIDTEFYNQHQTIADLIGVEGKSKIGLIKGTDAQGQPRHVLKGLTKPIYVVLENKKKDLIIRIPKPDESSARAFIRAKAKEVLKKGGEVLTNVEDIQLVEEVGDNQIFFGNNKPDIGKPEFKFSNKDLEMGFIKMAVNFYLFHKNPIDLIYDPIDFLCGRKSKYKKYFTFYLPSTIRDVFVNNNLFGKIYHLVHLRLDSKKKCIYCFIDLFGFQKGVVLLNDAYSGDDMEFTYAYDLIKREVINLDLEFGISSSFLSAIPFSKTNYNEEANFYFENTFNLICKLHNVHPIPKPLS